MKTKLSLTLLSSIFAFAAHAENPYVAAVVIPHAPVKPVVSLLTPEVVADIEASGTRRTLDFSDNAVGNLANAVAGAAQAQQHAPAHLAAQFGNLNLNR